MILGAAVCCEGCITENEQAVRQGVCAQRALGRRVTWKSVLDLSRQTSGLIFEC
jgi:hypothetical protein